MNEKEIVRSCIDCGVVNCNVQNKSYPKFCLTTDNLNETILKEALKLYEEKENNDVMINAANIESESRILASILRKKGFEVFGIACKAGAVKKDSVGINESCKKVGDNMCNPIYQAKKLNSENTQLNIVMGLCVGHDSLFYKYSNALVTTLVTKDRVLGHNPAAALYTSNSYYHRYLKKLLL